MAFVAGIGFSILGFSARTLDPSGPFWGIVFDPSVLAIVLNGPTAAVVFAMALQQSGATGATAVMFTTNTALSSLIRLIYRDDRVRDGFAAVAVTA